MNDEREIVERIRAHNSPDSRYSVEVSTSEGWDSLISDLLDRLEEVNPEWIALQVKSKFGGLRFYGMFNEAGQALVDEADRKSTQICELCGEPGSSVSIRHWIWTLCSEHAATQAARNPWSEEK